LTRSTIGRKGGKGWGKLGLSDRNAKKAKPKLIKTPP